MTLTRVLLLLAVLAFVLAFLPAAGVAVPWAWPPLLILGLALWASAGLV